MHLLTSAIAIEVGRRLTVTMVSDSTLGSLIDSDSNCLAPDNDEVVGTFESTALSEASESILRSDGTAGTGSDVPGVESNVVVTAAGAPPAAPTCPFYTFDAADDLNRCCAVGVRCGDQHIISQYPH